MTPWFPHEASLVIALQGSGNLWTGSSLVVALVAGLVAFLAPCCVSVMLPAYLSAFLQNRWRIVAMTLIYGTGVATVVLPLALGAAVLRQFILGQHAVAFGIGGALLVALGIYTLLGGSASIPMPHLRQKSRRGPLGIYAMGVVAGLASACCAPVLIGVVAISGLAPSFFTSLALGLAYIAGMVGPLFVMALFWTRIEPKLDKVTRPRTVRLRLGILSRELSGTAFASGMLLLAMGGVTLWMAASGQSMLSAGGWEANFAAGLNHFGHIIDDALGGVPGIFVAIVLAVIVILILFTAGAEVGCWGRNALGHQKNEQGQATALMTPIDEKGQDANVE